MKLLFVNQYYWPDSAATAQMLTDLAEHLVSHGHDVHILCSRGRYDAGSFSGRRPPRFEQHNGVNIHRISATGFGKQRFAGQAIDFLSFHLLTGLRTLLSAFSFDVIVSLTTPPLIGMYGGLARLIGRAKHVSWVMDLHPDCEFELGMLNRHQFLPRLADAVNRWQMRSGEKSVVLGRYMARRLLAKGVSRERIEEIPVWGHDPHSQDPSLDNRSISLRDQLDLTGKFVVMYSGNAGLVHTFSEVCQAALRLKDDPRFVFLFIGGGRRLPEIHEFQAAHGLTNLRHMNYLPREQLRESLALADAHLITLRRGLSGVSVPCKLYGIMAVARPALFIGPRACETAEAVSDTQCGRYVTNDDVDGLVRILQELAADPALCRRLGENGRLAYEQIYNPQRCGEQWRMLLENLMIPRIGGSPRPRVFAPAGE